MIILLSPSKAINFKPVAASVNPTEPQFLDKSKQLVSTVNSLGKNLGKTLGVSDALAEENRQRFADWTDQPRANDSCPAAWAYRGETFAGLSIENLNATELQFAQDHLRIVSGLYGLLRPTDQLLPYRLEMTTKLASAWGKNLYEFWGSTLADHVASQQPSFVLSCASDAYAKVVTKHLPKNIPVITPKFLHQGKSKMAFAKYSRGLMARWAVQNKIHSADDVKKFDAEGYTFDAAASTANEFVFNAPDDFSLKGRWTKL